MGDSPTRRTFIPPPFSLCNLGGKGGRSEGSTDPTRYLTRPSSVYGTPLHVREGLERYLSRDPAAAHHPRPHARTRDGVLEASDDVMPELVPASLEHPQPCGISLTLTGFGTVGMTGLGLAGCSARPDLPIEGSPLRHGAEAAMASRVAPRQPSRRHATLSSESWTPDTRPVRRPRTQISVPTKPTGARVSVFQSCG